MADTKESSDFQKRWMPPPMRRGSDDTDDDGKRTRWASEKWEAQDPAYRLRDRSIEGNIRMLSGQQWVVWHALLGHVDISAFFSDEEKRWRQRPVMDRLRPYYITTHSKMTENPFDCAFRPGPDDHDAELAEKLGILFDLKWDGVGMRDVWSRCSSWMIAAGTGFLYSRVDLSKGEFETWEGEADLELLRGDGSAILGPDGQPMRRKVPRGVPFNAQGEPQAILRGESEEDEGRLEVTGEAHRERTGDIVVDVLSPLEVRGQWGPKPWHDQKLHFIRSYLTPQEIFERWKIEVEPDITDVPSGSAGFMERLLFGSGMYGSASSPMASVVGGATSATQADGYSLVQTSWMAPSNAIKGMEETRESPGGRMLVTTKNKVLYDGPRPFRCKYTSPVRCYEFVRIPGRPWGSTPLEIMISPQKAYNQGWRQILENRALTSNPQQVYDLDSGLRADQIDNKPGRQYGVRRRKQNIPPIEWIRPPEMGSAVWRAQAMLQQELSYMGSSSGLDAAQRTSKKASGELVRELRFDDDRFLGPAMRTCAEEFGRMAEDWMQMFPVIYTTRTVLRYTGEDDAARTLVLMPELLREGQASVVPDIESMLPEGRGERRSRDYAMWQAGAFGDPKSPQARRVLMERLRYGPAAMNIVPSGRHIAFARQENMIMLEGRPGILHDWQDHEAHLDVHENFMSTPEWERLPDQTKALFIEHRMLTLEAMVQKQQQMRMLAMRAAQPPMGLLGPGQPPAPGAEAGPEAAPDGAPVEAVA